MHRFTTHCLGCDSDILVKWEKKHLPKSHTSPEEVSFNWLVESGVEEHAMSDILICTECGHEETHRDFTERVDGEIMSMLEEGRR